MVTSEEKKKILDDIRKKGVKFVEWEFVDILGNPKMCETPVGRTEEILNEGLWFDGSSVDGFTRIHESDMFLIPDASTYVTLPWTNHEVARVVCDVYIDEKTPFEGDPRFILKKQMDLAAKKGFQLKVGPELEFFLFKLNGENGGEEHLVHDAAGYFDLATKDLAVGLKRKIVSGLEALGIPVEMSHHEVAPGQHEIDFRYNDALAIADAVMLYKYTVKTLAKEDGLHPSFMPKPVYGINGSGMHVHQSIWTKEGNAFYDAKDPYTLSETARYYIAGILHHARALTAVTNPTVNSFKRLVPGYEAPVYVCWGRVNRSALIRIPRAKGKSSTRIEVRFPDPSSNPYLAFSAMLAAGLDGIEKKMALPEPVEENVYHFDDAKLKAKYIKTLPASLHEAVNELESDEVLKKVLGSHIHERLKAAQLKDWDDFRTQVTPWEKQRYFYVL